MRILSSGATSALQCGFCLSTAWLAPIQSHPRHIGNNQATQLRHCLACRAHLFNDVAATQLLCKHIGSWIFQKPCSSHFKRPRDCPQPTLDEIWSGYCGFLSWRSKRGGANNLTEAPLPCEHCTLTSCTMSKRSRLCHGLFKLFTLALL